MIILKDNLFKSLKPGLFLFALYSNEVLVYSCRLLRLVRTISEYYNVFIEVKKY